jgi:hypothetical protein
LIVLAVVGCQCSSERVRKAFGSASKGWRRRLRIKQNASTSPARE